MRRTLHPLLSTLGLLSLLSLLGLVAGPALAEAPSDEALARALEAQPGVAVTRGEDNGTSWTEWRRAGVFYRLERRGAEERMIGDDESGAGAAMCSWGIYALVRDALADCPADRFPTLRADLDRDIAALEAFIVANSPTPVTVAELRAEAAAQRERALAPGPRVCAAGDVGAMATSLDDMGPEGRRAAIGKVLATPRWPVLNPCL